MRLQHDTVSFHFCVMLAVALGVSLFIYGFFPLKNLNNTRRPLDFPKKSINRTNPSISRLIFMVIDALRADFVIGPNGIMNMPYLTNLIDKKEACIFIAKANPPTVTMPRIKALLSGTIPGFVDIVLNLGSPKLTVDNFVTNLVLAKEKVIFYGDDTWLKLFPDTFSRSEGTTSFYVADYTEVDINVTRHISDELLQTDWTLLGLHYLGLDHIGHLYGPKSPLVQTKLREMDAVIQQIHVAAVKGGLPQLLLICGDHGMRNSGSHGGASQEETHTAVAAVGIACQSKKTEINQVDLASTLSVLLGLSEPAESIGTLIPELLLSLSTDQRLEALGKNSEHLATLLGSSLSNKQERLILEATKLHNIWSQNSTSELAYRVESLYANAALDMSQTLAQDHSTFDLYAMGIGIAIVFQCTLLLGMSVINIFNNRVESLWIYFIGTMLFVAFNTLFCSIINNNGVTCSLQYIGLFLQGMIAVIFSYSFIQIYFNRTSVQFPEHLMERYLIIGTFMHLFGLGASSLVEEEHQVWYFLWPTLLIILLQAEPKIWLLLFLNLVLHRMGRKWNQTGDKWASLPDVEDYLSGSKNMTTTVFFVGIVSIGCYLIKFGVKNKVLKSLYIFMLILIYLYRTATGGVHFPYLDHHLTHQGWIEARLFAICLIAVLIMGTYKGIKEKSSLVLACTFRDSWLLFVALLRRPHNVFLLPVQLFASRTISKTFYHNITALVTTHSWLGWVTYFYQGNSNSLATVDLAAGYVGLLKYQPGLVGSLLMCHTYSSPILSQLMLMCILLESNRLSEVQRGLRLYSMLRLLPMCTYLTVVVLQREHLFIWSVFAPKLLYEVAATFASFITLVPCYLCMALTTGTV